MSIQLSMQQDQAMKDLVNWYKGPDQYYVLAGFAGTGKSTLASLLKEHVSGTIHYCAFTGKAASVLNSKGVHATTLHQAIYLPKAKGQKRLADLRRLLFGETDERKRTELQKQIEKEEDNLMRPSFVLNLESTIKDVDLVVIDEYSMLDEVLVRDLLSIAKKVLFLGDPGQLPPVQGSCPLKPNFFLEEVHRQALDSPILRAATQARTGGIIDFGDFGDFKRVKQNKTSFEDYRDVDQVIVARNKTRHYFNKRFRENLGLYGIHEFPEMPVQGDKLICTKNDRDLGIFNGEIGYASKNSEIHDESSILLNFEHYEGIKCWSGIFQDVNRRPQIWEMKELSHFDYGYAITCHKSQGSEFDSILVYNEGFRREKEKWLYTAITRGKNKVIMVDP